ncbi:MAG: hypothetical protein KAI47_17135 [Deltaproteobacteria bacterium]|nr:hypothetical protein [Deltaproteobacteria bacterium]
MNWVLQRLAAAMIAGIGIKLGSDLYDGVKAKVKDRREPQAQEEEKDDLSTATAAVVDREVPLESKGVTA